jgi:hypothetical protein
MENAVRKLLILLLLSAPCAAQNLTIGGYIDGAGRLSFAGSAMTGYISGDGHLTLNGLTPFQVNSPTNGQCLTYSSSVTAWINSACGGGGGSGTVTSVSVASANGLSGTVTNPTTTPAITLAPTFTGIAYSNGTGLAAAVAANFPTLNQSTTGNAATATALAANPTDCAANQYATTIDAAGNLTCAQVAAAQVTGLATSATTDTTNAANITSGTLPNARIVALPEANTILGTAIAPTALTTNTNNYSPTGGSGADIWTLSSTANIDLTGIVGCTLNRTLTLRNGGSFTITLRDQSSSSSAANRFIFSVTNAFGATTDEVLAPGMAVQLRGTGNGCVPVMIGQVMNVDATLNDVLMLHWIGPDNVVLDGANVDGAGGTQITTIGAGQYTNECNTNGNCFYVIQQDGTGASAVAGMNATVSSINALWQANSAAAPAFVPNGPAGANAYLGVEGTTASLCFSTGVSGPNNGSCADVNWNWTLKTTSTATNATNGFIYWPSTAGVPSATPAKLTGTYANAQPMLIDNVDDFLFMYRAGWKSPVPKLIVSTVSGLPTCTATLQGSMRAVSDATAPTYNGTLIGGGAVIVPVFCNGSAWTSH